MMFTNFEKAMATTVTLFLILASWGTGRYLQPSALPALAAPETLLQGNQQTSECPPIGPTESQS